MNQQLNALKVVVLIAIIAFCGYFVFNHFNGGDTARVINTNTVGAESTVANPGPGKIITAEMCVVTVSAASGGNCYITRSSGCSNPGTSLGLWVKLPDGTRGCATGIDQGTGSGTNNMKSRGAKSITQIQTDPLGTGSNGSGCRIATYTGGSSGGSWSYQPVPPPDPNYGGTYNTNGSCALGTFHPITNNGSQSTK